VLIIPCAWGSQLTGYNHHHQLHAINQPSPTSSKHPRSVLVAVQKEVARSLLNEYVSKLDEVDVISKVKESPSHQASSPNSANAPPSPITISSQDCASSEDGERFQIPSFSDPNKDHRMLKEERMEVGWENTH
jgi:hypothetical protein